MQLAAPSTAPRTPNAIALSADLIVVGGGLAGTCAAINAAREGIKVILVQDRPVLGGNSSSEVRLWALGATSHMANNNRWSREGGLVDELLVENTYRNREGNTILWDALLLEKVRLETNITLLLNTAVDGLEKSAPDTIASVTAYCPQNETRYTLRAPLFCDASGDGIVGFQAGAAFRMGAEKADEFNEGFAPDTSYGELLGHTIYFYSKDTGQPVTYVPPAFALKDITKIPRFKDIRAQHTGCNFWWIEYGGRRDTIAETEDIKWELWSIVYGIWNHIKNSGEFPEAANLTLEWVGTIPGKRESRRFEGGAMLTQADVIEQRVHPDVIATGGWSLDLHPSDAIYSKESPCNQYHSKGIYGIPYRCFYSRNIDNLFLAGRVISASHVAFGSSRVILTCGHGGAAVGVAAAQCILNKLQPRDLTEPAQMACLQATLNRQGHAIPGLPTDQSGNLADEATLTASSTLALSAIPADDGWRNLDYPLAQLLPFEPGYTPAITFRVRAAAPTTLRVALRTSDKAANYTPEITLEEQTIALQAGEQTVTIQFTQGVPTATYAFLTLYPGTGQIEVPTSAFRCTGLVSVEQKYNKKVAKAGAQTPPPGIGIDAFEFWIPTRRPWGQNLPLQLDPPLTTFASPAYLTNGFDRPWLRTNAWIADPKDPSPTLTVSWPAPVTFNEITLSFDTDFDHALETAQWNHPENVMPFVVRHHVIKSADGTVLHTCTDNHQTLNRITLPEVTTTDRITITLEHPGPNTPAALFGLRIG